MINSRRIISLVLIVVTLLTGTLFINIEAYGNDIYNSGKGIIGSVSEIGTYKVNQELNLREGPSTGDKVLIRIPEGIYIQVTDISGGWGYTSYLGHKRWSSLDYATFISKKYYSVSDYGLNFLKSLEGFSKYAYEDVNGWRIGYGTPCGKDEYPDGITEEKATELLLSIIPTYENYLDLFLGKNKIILNQNKYDALFSFTYNLGNVWVKYDEFDLKTYLINGSSKYTDQQIKDAFLEFRYSAGEELPGLKKRRAMEAELFLTDSYSLFDDVNDNAWFFPAVKYAFENNLFSGTSSTTFEPDSVMTRAMFVTVLSGIENADVSEYTESSFSDVSVESWYFKYVEWAYQKGLVKGIGEGLFGPEEPITREQLALLIFQLGQRREYDTSGRVDLSKYTDASNVSDWALEAIEWAVYEGIISGTSETTISARDTAKRAQVAQMLMKFNQNIIE